MGVMRKSQQSTCWFRRRTFLESGLELLAIYWSSLSTVSRCLLSAFFYYI